MHKEIIQLLNEKRLKEAFTQIKESANTLNNWELKAQVETQQTTYEYMLQYMAMGTQDPQREAIYNQLLCKGYELADKTYFLKEWDKAYGYFADTFRKFAQTPPHSFKELDFMLEILCIGNFFFQIAAFLTVYTAEHVEIIFINFNLRKCKIAECDIVFIDKFDHHHIRLDVWGTAVALILGTRFWVE